MQNRIELPAERVVIDKLGNLKELSQFGNPRKMGKFINDMDVSYNSIIKLETGRITNPTIKTLQKIAKALEVKVDDLIN